MIPLSTGDVLESRICIPVKLPNRIMDGVIHRHPECETRLYTLSLIKISNNFWERQEIQTEVQNFFLENSNYEWKPKDWHKITQKVLNFADSCDLNATILLDLKDAILNTGTKMFEWIMYVHWDFGLDINHALPILWTPLGFVDEVRIFKSIWVNDASLYVGSPEKPIFLIACMLAQEDFIKEHETEMVEELKKLPLEANFDNVELEVVNYSDKVYGIISTYLCYFVDQDLENKDYYFYASGIKESKEKIKETEERKLWDADEQGVLRKHVEEAIYEGLILPPEIMAKLCGWPGLLHGVKYYMKKLNRDQKREVGDWLMRYFDGRCHAASNNPHCRARKFWKISALLAEDLEPLNWEPYRSNEPICIFLHACPLESVLWRMVRNFLNYAKTTHAHLDGFLDMTFHFTELDQYFGIPNTRYFYQKLLKKIRATFNHRKMQREFRLYIDVRNYCDRVQDFTMLKAAYETYDLFKGYLEYSRLKLFSQIGFDDGIPNFEIFEKFFDQMFDCHDDRVRFLLGAFHECRLLLDHDFDSWEKLYSSFDIPTPLRDSIDPMKCLCSLGVDMFMFRFPDVTDITNTEKCDKFIKWWHKSNEEDQKNLKEKFKKSPYLTECIYKLWTNQITVHDRAPEKSSRLLQWLFDSEYEISKFKKEKLSIVGLLETSLTLSDVSLHKNDFYEYIDEFVIFSEVTAESLANAKDEIRSKIEEWICKFLTRFNIKTFNFLMNWVSVSEEVKKRIFQNLMESSKILKLCEDFLNNLDWDSCLDIFYNEWLLKYCEDISMVKCYLLSKYKGFRSECYMSELSSIYERLERGERVENFENVQNLYLFL